MPDPTLDETTQRRLGVALFNRSRQLLELPERTAGQDDELLHVGHAACYHWNEVGGPRQRRIGENQCARVNAALLRREAALHHANRCLELVHAGGELEDWELASALEVMARAHLTAGNRDEAKRYATRAREELATGSRGRGAHRRAARGAQPRLEVGCRRLFARSGIQKDS